MVCPVCITTTITTVIAPTVLSAVAAIKIKQIQDRKKPIKAPKRAQQQPRRSEQD